MAILLLITDLELGGTPTVVRELAIGLHRVGQQVEVACLWKWGPVADQLRNTGVPVTALNATGATDLRILPRLVRLIRAKEFTTVFSFLIHANAMAAVASLFVRDVRWIQAIQTTQPNPRWHWLIQRIAHRAAEKIVVPSQSVATVAEAWSGIPRAKMVIIPNALDLSDWASPSPIAAADPRPYPITFLGRLDPIKDVPTLVHAVAQLNAETGGALVHLHIYGQGEDRPRIENVIRTSRAPATMHGAITTPHTALSKSGLLVLPSLAEGFGLVLIEAMAAGVPVIATDVPGIRDVVQHETTGLLVAASDANALAAAIRRLVEDPQLRAKLIRNASELVRTKFNWETVLPQYDQLLK
jgi:glycosyltransferase involved in cell wall biosynthesis